jgi:hypothetical protein
MVSIESDGSKGRMCGMSVMNAFLLKKGGTLLDAEVKESSLDEMLWEENISSANLYYRGPIFLNGYTRDSRFTGDTTSNVRIKRHL